MQVVEANGSLGVIAHCDIAAGEEILTIQGVVVDRPSRHSLQVGENTHIEVPAALAAEADSESGAWRYLNHSCNPNGVLVGRTLVALRAVARGESITFDYNTTEYDMASPFRCSCGFCGGRLIRGFRHLSPDEQRALEPRLAPHLRPILGGVGDA